MKNYTFITAALLSVVTTGSIYAKPHSGHHERAVKVMVKADADNEVNQLNIDGEVVDLNVLKSFIKDYKGINKDHDENIKIVIDDQSEKKLKSSRKMVKIVDFVDQTDNEDHENVEIFIDNNGGEVKEKVIVNGKELTKEELKKFKSSGKMKVFHLDKHSDGEYKKKTVFVNSSGNASDVDVDIIIDQLKDSVDIDKEKVFVKAISNNDPDRKIKHVIKKHIKSKSDKGASLGFMTSVKKDGWHLVKVIEGSGAEEAGIKTGDVVKVIANVDLTETSDSNGIDVDVLPKFNHGDHIKVLVERDGEKLDFDVEARNLDEKMFAFDWRQTDDDQAFKWIDDSDDEGLLKKIKVMVFDGEEGDFKLMKDDINMVLPKDLSDMNIFISDGSSTSKLLGGSHEMSSLSEGLSKYFHTSGGVLVLHVDESNVFSLKDGDVIKSVNDQQVNKPKEVVKALVLAKDQQMIELSVIRNKVSKKLKYQK